MAGNDSSCIPFDRVYRPMYETILVGTDGSVNANRAVVRALKQAEQYDSTLHGIFVVDSGYFDDPASEVANSRRTTWKTEDTITSRTSKSGRKRSTSSSSVGAVAASPTRRS